jgi:hypothetical protein
VELKISIDKRLPKFIDIAKTKNPETLLKVSSVSNELAACLVRLNQPENVRRSLLISNSSILSHLILHSKPEQTIQVDIDGKGLVNLTLKNKRASLNSSEWLQAWYSSTIIRNEKSLIDLYRMDPNLSYALNENDHIMIAFYKFLYIHSLGEKHTPEQKLFEKMKELTENNLKGYYMPDVEEFPYPNFFINFNQALILKSIIDKDIETFNKHLTEGLEYHKLFWSQKKGLNKGDAPLCDNPKGFISWPLTALAALAHDNNIPVVVQSEYIPQILVEGKFK